MILGGRALRYWLVSVIGLGMVSLGGYALATELYGAIAYSKSTGSHGYALNYSLQELAENQAIIACEDAAESGDCTVLLWFRNACGALARHRRTPVAASNIGTGWGQSRSEAEAKAQRVCRENGGEDCDIVRSECTGS